MNQRDDRDNRTPAERYAAAAARARENFARGVERARGSGPFMACDGCAKLLRPADLAEVTPLGALCRDCSDGLRQL